MAEPSGRHSNRQVSSSQAPLHVLARHAKAPEQAFEVLTVREACRRWDALYPELIYALAREGHLHPVRVEKRLLYPEWELAELVKRLYRAGSEFGTRAA